MFNLSLQLETDARRGGCGDFCYGGDARRGAPFCACRAGCLAGPINLSPMSDFHYDHGQKLILNFVEDAVHPLPNSIPVLSRQFFASLRARFLGERLDTF